MGKTSQISEKDATSQGASCRIDTPGGASSCDANWYQPPRFDRRLASQLGVVAVVGVCLSFFLNILFLNLFS
ncbi:MAG TPA: hypothetical protein PKD54_08990, partial [Pirellulaceae bacterium]|nr:hypothetical protein [Pirellulaceae bacterium]